MIPVAASYLNFPRSVITYQLRLQGSAGPLESQQQYWGFACLSDANLAAWIAGAGGGNPATVVLEDPTGYWLAPGDLTFTCYAGGAAPAVPDSINICNLVSQAGMSNVQVKQAWELQINAYARKFLSNIYDYRTMKAIDLFGGGVGTLKIMSPVAMAGAATVSGVHPFGAIVQLRSGLFHPLVYGIIGKRRHVFAVSQPGENIG